ncbi:uncharacterized protein B0T23DRAFT_324407 [Neurospora hispaniola]|uniref:Uncharacterized protein n=1 Tax=Neurospora hispaniola TaxID=588809 RepID=A0AAJ0I130_9PEZI|nr:hypothetical protein B0T23DRAFT_324407 [Neurospora hispaniola]
MSGKSKARPEEARKGWKEREKQAQRWAIGPFFVLLLSVAESLTPFANARYVRELKTPALAQGRAGRHLRTCNPLVICPTALEGNGLISGHLFLSFSVVAHDLLLIHVHLPQYSIEKHHMESPSETSKAGQHSHTTHIAGVQRGVSRSGRPTIAWNMATRGLTTTAIFTGTHITPKHPD